ncbi:hypothetical protein F5Y18DRAFT_246361 [Xylariaceae sp. FL1019]|nr:hypothetical protein F5Y18DRAFT_246361 [Xylariaceae sp. FL1019]
MMVVSLFLIWSLKFSEDCLSHNRHLLGGTISSCRTQLGSQTATAPSGESVEIPGVLQVSCGTLPVGRSGSLPRPGPLPARDS